MNLFRTSTPPLPLNPPRPLIRFVLVSYKVIISMVRMFLHYNASALMAKLHTNIFEYEAVGKL